MEIAGDDPATQESKRPVYASRCPPLVQPLQFSPFADRVAAKYGADDLAREWIALFQTIGGSCGIDGARRSAAAKSSSMKMNIPDTIFLSPTGQPSMWYKTTASKHVKARQLAAVTVRSIREQFTSRSAICGPCAVVRTGYEVQTLDTNEFLALCDEMDHACIRVKRPRREILPDTDTAPPVYDASDHDTEPATDHSIEVDVEAHGPFCVQQFIPRDLDSSFLCVWKQFPADESSSPRPKSSVELFLIQRRHSDTAQHGFRLLRLTLEGSGEKPTRKTLADIGFAVDDLVPLLLQMKLLTTEIVGRVNRINTTRRQAVSVACEFFVHTPQATTATDTNRKSPEVYFASLAGIQWHGQQSTWDALRRVDSLSNAIAEAYSSSSSRRKRTTRGPTSPKTPTGIDTNLSLTLYYELNPRFPSLQSPHVAENQWKYKTALLPPHVSPRYVGAEMPKMYREGQFQPLLTASQSDAVNRLTIPLTNAQPSPLSPRHPLSKRHADVERDLWARTQDPLGFTSPTRRPGSPRSSPQSPQSPRNRYRSIIKEEIK